MNKFYERISDGELFVFDDESKKFYLQSMKKFKDKGHLINEYREEDLDKLAKSGFFKKHSTKPVVIARHNGMVNLNLKIKKLKEATAAKSNKK